MIPEFNPNQPVVNQATNNTTPVNRFCVICQDDIDSDIKEVALKCNHIFHEECIKGWLKLKHRCPTCNEEQEGIETAEVPFTGMTLADILAVPDTQPHAQAAQLPHNFDMNGFANMIENSMRLAIEGALPQLATLENAINLANNIQIPQWGFQGIQGNLGNPPIASTGQNIMPNTHTLIWIPQGFSNNNNTFSNFINTHINNNGI